MVGLGDLLGRSFESQALSVSGDGVRVVGSGTTPSGERAFLWDPINGMRDFHTVLTTEEGLWAELEGWMLTVAHAISADGTAIVGQGLNPFGQTEAWRAQIAPVPLPRRLMIGCADPWWLASRSLASDGSSASLPAARGRRSHSFRRFPRRR